MIAIVHFVVVGGVSLLTGVLLYQGVKDAIHVMSFAALFAGLSLLACIFAVIQTRKPPPSRKG